MHSGMLSCSVTEQEYEPQADDASFVEKFEQNVKNTIERFDLIDSDEKILVAASGGKDSTVLLFVLHKLRYNVEAFTVDIAIGCYTKKNLENIRTFCQNIGVKLHESSFKEEFGHSMCYMRDMLKSRGLNLTSCNVCGTLRRYVINKLCRKISPSKIATGHNMDDEAQTIFMNMLKNRSELNARIGPKTGLNDKRFVQRIKPLYLTPEKDIIRYSKIMNFPVQYSACPCSRDSLRKRIRNFFAEYETINPTAARNIVENFLEVLPQLRKKYVSKENLFSCNSCGEPSKGKICRPCQLLLHMKHPLEGLELGNAELSVAAAGQTA